MARTEDDLRAAFQLAAQDAPSTQDVLARLDAAQRPPVTPYRPSKVRRWLPAVAVAAAVIAVAVPVGFAISSGDGNRASSSSASIAGADKAVPGAASSAASGDVVQGSAIGGPTSGGAPLVAPTGPTSAGVPEASGPVCTPDDVTLSLAWTDTASGLRGTLTARNISGIACDLAVKPAIYPLGANRVRLDVQNVMTAEGYAGPSNLLPGASATSAITWSSWCGAKADTGAQVDWGVGPATVSVSGPTTPSCVGGKSGAISSTWFGPLS